MFLVLRDTCKTACRKYATWDLLRKHLFTCYACSCFALYDLMKLRLSANQSTRGLIQMFSFIGNRLHAHVMASVNFVSSTWLFCCRIWILFRLGLYLRNRVKLISLNFSLLAILGLQMVFRVCKRWFPLENNLFKVVMSVYGSFFEFILKFIVLFVIMTVILSVIITMIATLFISVIQGTQEISETPGRNRKIRPLWVKRAEKFKGFEVMYGKLKIEFKFKYTILLTKV